MRLIHFQFYLLFLLFCHINSIATLGYIDLQIRQLVFKKTPPGCITEKNSSTSLKHCLMDFRVCVGIAEFPFIRQQNKDCQILQVNFTLSLQGTLLLDDINRTMAMFDAFPVKQYDVTSDAIGLQNIFIELAIWSSIGSEKLLLFTRNYLPSLDVIRTRPKTVTYNLHGNIFIYEIKAVCSPGYNGEGCAVLCKPPLSNDNYVCTPNGMQCHVGWNGTRCDQPICLQPCANGGRCIRPNQCACPTGWDGPQCTHCKPKAGCQNGYCVDEPGKCFCQPNWTGADCDLKINKCLDKPCKNGGRCTTYGIHGDFFRCSCPLGFTGIDCSFSYTDCTKAICGPNGHCQPQINGGYICACAPGFSGADCNERVKTDNNVLMYNGEQRYLEQQLLISNNNTNTFYKWTEEIGMVRALLAACFCMLLILSILCCGFHCFSSPYTSITTSCIYSSSRLNVTSSFKVDKIETTQKRRINWTTNQQSSTRLVHIRPRTEDTNRCTGRLATTIINPNPNNKEGDSELGICSAESHTTQPLYNTQLDPDDIQQQRHAQRNYWNSLKRVVAAVAPPPSYEESVTFNHTNQTPCHEQTFI